MSPNLASPLPPNRIRFARALVAACALAPLARAGSVLRVGPGRAFADVQSAVDAANHGDLVLVDPGLYPRFVVDGKELTIAAASASFSISGMPGQPEITVQNVPAGRTVTLHAVHLDFDDELAPALLAIDNAGAVRVSELDVELAGNLIDAQVSAAVIVENTATFWLRQSSIWSRTTRLGNTLFPLCVGVRCNDGISALELRDSSGAIHNSRLRGYFNDYTALGSGGDGLRAIGDCNLRLYENALSPRQPAIFMGGDGVFGGHAVHQVRSPANSELIRSCSSGNFTPLYERGTGVPTIGGEPGGYYGINNDKNSFFFGGAEWFRFVEHCDPKERNEVAIDPPVVGVGGTLTVRLRSFLERDYALLIADATRHRAYRGFGGRALLDPARTLFLSFGTTPEATALSFPLSVPSSSSLIGLQITAQGVFGPPGGALRDFSLPAMTVIGP